MKRHWRLLVPVAAARARVVLDRLARPGLAGRPRRLHRRHVGVGRRRDRAQPALGGRAGALRGTPTIKQSIPPPHPRFSLVFSAFSVGLFANAVLPGRVGELARVAVLRRRCRRHRRERRRRSIGSVFAHRMFDLFPAVTLVIWVLLTAKIPQLGDDVDRDRARPSGCCCSSPAVVLAPPAAARARRARPRSACSWSAPAQGLAIMRSPLPAATAADVPVRRLDLPALRGLGGDGGVPHPPAARGGRARARADQRRDDLPALARATSASCRSPSRCRS